MLITNIITIPILPNTNIPIQCIHTQNTVTKQFCVLNILTVFVFVSQVISCFHHTHRHTKIFPIGSNQRQFQITVSPQTIGLLIDRKFYFENWSVKYYRKFWMQFVLFDFLLLRIYIVKKWICMPQNYS